MVNRRVLSTFLLFIIIIHANSQNCETANWHAVVECLSGNDPEITNGSFINNGRLYIPSSKVIGCPGYYWTSFWLDDTICVPNNFSFEIRLKDPVSEGGIPSFDVGIGLTSSNGINASASLLGPGGLPWTNVQVGNNSSGNNDALIMDFTDWHVIGMKFLNNVLHYTRDSMEFFQLPYTGDICNIQKINAGFKGSGSIDWMRILDENGNELWREDFNSCSTLIPFPKCNPSPIVLNANYLAPTCQNNELQLFALANQSVTYLWTGPNGFTSNLQNPTINYPNAQNQGTYTVNATINNCYTPVSQTVNFNDALPTANKINITKSICQGETYFAEGNYQNKAGIYIDTLTNSAGCDSVRTLNLIVISKTYSTINQTICEGQSYLGHTASGTYVDTLLNVAGCDSVRSSNLTVIPKTYSTINQIICEGQSYLGHTASGTYVDTLLNVAGCDSVRTLNLIVYPSPTVFAGNDTSLIAGNSVLLTGSSVSNNIISFQWLPNYAIDNITLLNPTVNPLNTTVYKLTATNSLGCTASDSLKVTVIPKYEFLIPNAFTPNGDGKNDVFKPIFFVVPTKYEMSIYNRYGQLIFETEDYTKGWNGTVNGITQNASTYVWIIKYTLQSGYEKIEKGTVVLIK